LLHGIGRSHQADERLVGSDDLAPGAGGPRKFALKLLKPSCGARQSTSCDYECHEGVLDVRGVHDHLDWKILNLTRHIVQGIGAAADCYLRPYQRP
jgi:hypothetical protein